MPIGGLIPEDFERLCLRLAERRSDVQSAAALYGVSGQKQKGIDVLVLLPSGKYQLIQSRRIKSVTPAGIKKAVKDFLAGDWSQRADCFVYAASAAARRTEVQDEIVRQREVLGERQIDFEVWDAEFFSRELERHPDLVSRFFGPAVLQAFDPKAAGQSLVDEIVEALASTFVGQGQSFAAIPDADESLLADQLMDMVLAAEALAPDLQEVLAELREFSRTEAARLAAYVKDDPRRARDLIRDAQSWTRKASWR